jgi:hypothetical protein
MPGVILAFETTEALRTPVAWDRTHLACTSYLSRARKMRAVPGNPGNSFFQAAKNLPVKYYLLIAGKNKSKTYALEHPQIPQIRADETHGLRINRRNLRTECFCLV